MSDLPSYDLELKADEERKRLHSSVAELKSHLHRTLDVRRNVRENLALICGVAGVAGVAAGYLFTGVFLRH